MQLVSFKLAQEEYGIEITKVQEIILMGEITRVPQTPNYVKGLINLRSTVIPIVDLRLRFGLSEEPPTDERGSWSSTWGKGHRHRRRRGERGFAGRAEPDRSAAADHRRARTRVPDRAGPLRQPVVDPPGHRPDHGRRRANAGGGRRLNRASRPSGAAAVG